MDDELQEIAVRVTGSRNPAEAHPRRGFVLVEAVQAPHAQIVMSLTSSRLADRTVDPANEIRLGTVA